MNTIDYVALDLWYVTPSRAAKDVYAVLTPLTARPTP